MEVGCHAPDSQTFMVVVVGTDSHSRCGKSRKIKAIDGSMVYKGNSCNKGEWTLVEAWRKDVRG